MTSGKTRRLWMVEKPFWLLVRRTLVLWQWAVSIWSGVMRFLNSDAPSLVILCSYAVAGAVLLSRWPVSRNWLGLHRNVDIILLTIFILWSLMFLIWSHQRLQEQVLRWIPASLSAPIWLPPLLILFILLTITTGFILAFSIALTPLGVLAMLVGLLYSWWRSRHGITVRCTKGECLSGHRRFRDLEVNYVCPNGCGGRYTFLIPSHLGLIYHNCTCGAKLPALPLLRKRKNKEGKSVENTLKKVCPSGHPWGIGSEPLPSYFVAVVGGQSAGKTCYMTMAVQGILDGVKGSNRLWADFESDKDRTGHNKRLCILREGHKLPETHRGVPEAMVMRLHIDKQRDTRLYFYDAAGEEYSRLERDISEEFEFFEDLTGVILLVDPLGLPELHQKIKTKSSAAWKSLGVSQTPFEDVVASLRRNVRRFLRYGQSGRSDVPVAVVINKVDVPIISTRIGSEAVQRASTTHNLSKEDGYGVEHQLCRTALVEWGASKEISALENDFARIRYFSCSSLGRAPDGSGQPFVAERVLPPLLWLLGLEFLEKKRRL